MINLQLSKRNKIQLLKKILFQKRITNLLSLFMNYLNKK